MQSIKLYVPNYIPEMQFYRESNFIEADLIASNAALEEAETECRNLVTIFILSSYI